MNTVLPRVLTPSLTASLPSTIPHPWISKSSRSDSSSSRGKLAGDEPRALSSGSHFSANSSTHIESPKNRRENERPSTHTLRSLDSDDHTTRLDVPRRVSTTHLLRKTSWGTDIPSPKIAGGAHTLVLETEDLEEVDLKPGARILGDAEVVTSLGHANEVPLLEPCVANDEKARDHIALPLKGERSLRSLHRWINTLRRRSYGARDLPIRSQSMRTRRRQGRLSRESVQHRFSSSASSTAFFTGVKTASISLTSLSLPPHSKRLRPSSRLKSGTTSARLSATDQRSSTDSRVVSNAPVVNEGVWSRSVERRNILEELLSSEESYIADLKLLANVYFTLIASTPTLSQQTRLSIHMNVMDILHLHERLLDELHKVIPDFDTVQDTARPTCHSRAHLRWHSVEIFSTDGEDLNTERKLRRSIETENIAARQKGTMTAEPRLAADVARVFERLMSQFFAYEEYGAKYQLMLQDSASANKTIPLWKTYERGIEALANSLASINSYNAHSQKGLAFGDLLIKPIQRVCRYPILFADLYKQTPVYDCPESHAELEKVLYRLQETTREINRATDDPDTRSRIEKTWLLQDRLVFRSFDGDLRSQIAGASSRYWTNTQLPITSTNTIRLLGHVLVCGVLFVAWQGADRIQGQYLLCALFKSALILARVNRAGSRYDVVATIRLSKARIDAVNNRIGIDCHTALFTWKLLFESDNKAFELIMSACSAKEEYQWKSKIKERCSAELMGNPNREANPLNNFPSLCSDFKPIQDIWNQSDTTGHKLLLLRDPLLSSPNSPNAVIIRNTHAVKDGQASQSDMPASLARSHSLLGTNRIPILAPKRSERVRLEAALGDVWTRNILPYPGMAIKRGEHFIRASASSVMRKLSKASMSSNLTKRSASSISLPRASNQANGHISTNGDVVKASLDLDFECGSKRLDGSVRLDNGRRRHVYTGMLFEPPVRTSSSNNFTRSKSTHEPRRRPPLPDIESHPPCPSSLHNQHGHERAMKVKKRWSTPATLVKAWSTEGIRRFRQ